MVRSIPAPGRVGTVRACTVVQDDGGLLALYIAPANPCLKRAGRRGGPRGRILVEDTGTHESWTWTGTHALLLHEWGDAHITTLFWAGDWSRLLHFYIDLAEPFRRTAIGFDTRDLVLDATVSADRSSWSWKDEDELNWSVENGRLAARRVVEMRVEGRRSVERLMRADRYTEWETWRPDPSWRRPTIPPTWRKVQPGGLQ